ncbi:MAG: hypothetical protein IT381_07045 [Deltaproteobacteria bacterium]|nr:hypothetical protein [Deltaproteobacteria bacterium]
MHKVFPGLLLLAACAPPEAQKLTVTITASAPSAGEGERITLKANVKGQVGDVTYKWEQTTPTTPKLAFTSALLQETQVSIPSLCKDATFEIRVSIKDADGNQSAATTSLDGVNSDAALELKSIILSKTSTYIVGDLITLTPEAVGPGCGPKFAWSLPSPAGNGALESAPSDVAAKWRAPDAAGTYTVALVVSDEAGNALPVRNTSFTVDLPQYTRDIKPILNDNCGGCHGGNAPERDLRLNHTTAAAMETELTTRTPTDMAGTCNAPNAGAVFVTGGDLDNSVLWRRIDLDRNNKGSGCDQMPRNNTNFFVNNKDLLTRMRVWIQSGASFTQ